MTKKKRTYKRTATKAVNQPENAEKATNIDSRFSSAAHQIFMNCTVQEIVISNAPVEVEDDE